jgi:hypothetical protein
VEDVQRGDQQSAGGPAECRWMGEGFTDTRSADVALVIGLRKPDLRSTIAGEGKASR